MDFSSNQAITTTLVGKYALMFLLSFKVLLSVPIAEKGGIYSHRFKKVLMTDLDLNMKERNCCVSKVSEYMYTVFL